MITEVLYETFIVTPLFLDFYPKFQENLFMEEGFHVEAGLPAHLF
jgi:hypothetical protein